jgi:hypothetical protein
MVESYLAEVTARLTLATRGAPVPGYPRRPDLT